MFDITFEIRKPREVQGACTNGQTDFIFTCGFDEIWSLIYVRWMKFFNFK